MLDVFEEENQEKESATWRFVQNHLSTFVNADDLKQVETDQVLSPPVHEQLSSLFVMSCLHRKRFAFLTDEQLHDIAIEEMKKGRVRWETNIDETAGIYVFISLVESECYKVGETQNFRERIAKGHLRYGNQDPNSNLIDYCKSRGDNWPDCLRERELVALMLPLKSDSEDRQFIEFGLQKLLLPLMK